MKINWGIPGKKFLARLGELSRNYSEGIEENHLSDI